MMYLADDIDRVLEARHMTLPQIGVHGVSMVDGHLVASHADAWKVFEMTWREDALMRRVVLPGSVVRKGKLTVKF